MATLQTFEHVARAWLEHRATAWAPDTRAMIAASLDNNVVPKLGTTRHGELRGARWEEIDERSAQWRFQPNE